MPLTVKSQAANNEKHDYDITSLLFYNDKLYSAADDGKIKVWDESLKLVEQVQAHESSVFSIAIGDEDTLYSCSNDGMVKSWSLNPLKEKEIILKEENEIWKVFFNRGKLYVGDDAGLVKIFDNDKIVGILEIMHPITELMAIDNLVYTARDLFVLISEIYPDGKRISTIKSIQGRAPLCAVDGKLCFISRSGKDILVHQNNKKSEFEQIGKTNEAHEMIINALCSSSAEPIYLYSGGWDKTVTQWKFAHDSTLEKINSCSAEIVITALTAGPKNSIYAGGSDGNIVRIDTL